MLLKHLFLREAIGSPNQKAIATTAFHLVFRDGTRFVDADGRPPVSIRPEQQCEAIEMGDVFVTIVGTNGAKKLTHVSNVKDAEPYEQKKDRAPRALGKEVA